MAFQTYHHNKTTGVTYVYEAVSTWDKDKKQPINKQVCIGKLNPITGELIPSKRNRDAAAASSQIITATSLIAGPTLFLDTITKQLKLDHLLKKCFPENYDEIKSVVYFIVEKGTALCHCEAWCKSHISPSGKVLTSQNISRLLKAMTENARQTFFAAWSKVILEKEYLCYDISSVSSYSEGNEYIKYGYNRDHEKLPQINLAMIFGEESHLPVYFKHLPGSIPDVVTLQNTLITLDYLGSEKLHFVMDRGFYSVDNINGLFRFHHKFIISVPIGRKWVEEVIDKYYDEIASPKYYTKLGEDILYINTVLYKWGEERKRSYLHMYYNAHAAADEFDGFTEEILTYKEEMESGHRVKNHEEYYKRYFFEKTTPKRGLQITFNDEVIQKHRHRYAGYFVLFTNDIKDPLKALEIYRNKDVVENSFDDLKNQLDMKRLRIHSSTTMDSRLFLQFIALIYISQIRNQVRDNKKLANMTVREILEEMETLSKIIYSGRYGQVYTERTKLQVEIMEAFGVILET